MAERRVAAVTGASGAIGKAISRGLAKAGFEVVLICRDARKAERTRREIVETTRNDAVRLELCDISRRAQVAAFAAAWQGPLHVLINNAAAAKKRREETPEGLELQFATNILGYVWTSELLLKALELGAPSRVVNVASYWAGGLELDDLQFLRRRYDNDAAYRQSNQANRMLTVAHAARFAALGITVNACHPGDVNSTLSNNLGFGGHETPEQGADTPVWLATDAALAEQTGRYFEHRREVPCRFGADQQAVEELYAACQRLGAAEPAVRGEA